MKYLSTTAFWYHPDFVLADISSATQLITRFTKFCANEDDILTDYWRICMESAPIDCTDVEDTNKDNLSDEEIIDQSISS